MKTTALIEKKTDGKYGIYTPELEHTIIGEGNSVYEAKKDFENSLSEMIKSYEGEILPDELEELSFSFKHDISSLFDYFDFINVTKFAKRIGINDSLLRQYKQGHTYISEAQAKKIEKALHEVAEELLSVSLH